MREWLTALAEWPWQEHVAVILSTGDGLLIITANAATGTWSLAEQRAGSDMACPRSSGTGIVAGDRKDGA